MKVKRPDIFHYHDYQVFLRDWLAFKKASQPGFSNRELAKQAGLASGYLPMVLGRKRVLSGSAQAKILPYLGLSRSEQSFFENMVTLGTSDSHEARINSLDRMRRFPKFQKENRDDSESYQYLTHWFYVAIREMATMPDFKADPEWIQSRLHGSIPLAEIKTALDFLIENKYLIISKDQSVKPPKKALQCSGGVYRVALAQFHREVLGLASKAIETIPSEEREIQGHTVGLTEKGFQEARAIMEEALEKIRKLGEAENKSENVYHLEVALFPMTKKGKL
jgi:uncharacterized protein (TIGR02147 family)